jgi:hypothetical protein
LKLIPSVTRVFSKSRDMLVYLQAYEREAKSTEPLAVFVSFFRGSEKVQDLPPFTISTGMDPKSKAVPLKLSVPIGALAEGEYTCQITVIDPTTQKAAFWQTPVRIVP